MDSFFYSFFGQDLQDYWHWLNVLRIKRKLMLHAETSGSKLEL